MIDHTLNKAQLDKIFEENAIYMSDREVIPLCRLEEMFDEEVIDCADKGGYDYNCWGMVKCYYYSGFTKIVTTNNEKVLQSEMQRKKRQNKQQK